MINFLLSVMLEVCLLNVISAVLNTIEYFAFNCVSCTVSSNILPNEYVTVIFKI